MYIDKQEQPDRVAGPLVAGPLVVTSNIAMVASNCVTAAALLSAEKHKSPAAHQSMTVGPVVSHKTGLHSPESQQAYGVARTHAGLAGAWELDTIPLQARVLLWAQHLLPASYPACHHHMR